MSSNGQGVPRDDAEALRWYSGAAGKGDARAQYALAFAYGNGEGVQQDHEKALSWLHKAAERGSAEAEYMLGNMYREGNGNVARDYAEAIRWFRRGSDLGDKRARLALVSMYCTGRTTPIARWTLIAAILLVLPILVVPQRRWGRARWLPWMLCSAVFAIMTAHELLLAPLSSALFALTHLGPSWTDLGHVLLVALLVGSAAISALVAVRVAIRGSNRAGQGAGTAT
jgi:TPR repeat protein